MSSFFKYTAMLGVGLLLLYLAFGGQDPEEFKKSLAEADYFWVLASILVNMVAHVFRSIRWRMMISSLGHGTPSYIDCLAAVLAGYLANFIVPRMGEISRCALIGRKNDIPVVKLIGTVITERLADLLILFMILSLVVLFQFNLLSEFIYQNLISENQERTIAIWLVVFGFLIFAGGIFVFYILIKKKKWGFSERILKFFSEVKSGVLSVKLMEDRTGFVMLSALIWILYALSTYLCFFALNETRGLGFMEAMSVLVFASLAMIVPVQGGLGAFHWMVSEGLTLYDIPLKDGLVFALLIHSTQSIFLILAGGVSTIYLMFKRKIFQNEYT